jgi:lipopolysaccharide transport protein LptA
MTGCNWRRRYAVYWCTEGQRAWLHAIVRSALSATLCAGALLLRAASGAAADSAAEALPCNEPPMCYTASRLQADRNHITLYDIDIVDWTRGVSRIRAQRADATGQELSDSDIVLTGEVRVSMPEGELRADKATVRIAHNRITSMRAEGSPATFEHALGDSAQIAHGHASAISYDLERDEVQLQGDSWLTDGCNEINSDHILYDIASQRVQADVAPGESGRVHGTIRSRAGAP